MSTVHFWISLCILLQASGVLADSSLVVDTAYGYLEGFEENVGATKLHVYLGVPYAKPPVGDLRFRRPEEMSPWKGVKPATAFKPSCVQYNETLNFLPGMEMEMFNPDTGMSEDCLYLNIWAPIDASAEPKATMVWIHGGGFTVGSSTVEMYNGKKLAASKDVVIVSINYRLGTLGFLYNGKDEAPGNVALVDQQLALHWVKDNIAAFGGDPERITIFGESAGSASVAFHLLAEGSHDLFNYAILQSGVAIGFWANRKPDVAKEMSSAFAKSMGCVDADDVDCLLALSVESFMLSPTNITCPPTVDGYFLKETPRSILESGKAKKTNILIGFTKNEGTLFAPFWFPQWVNISESEVSLTEDQFHTMVESSVFIYANRNDSILNRAVEFHYKLLDWPSGSSYFDLYERISGDSLINCDVIDFSNHYASHGGNVYMYYLEHALVNSPLPKWMGATHGLDIYYVFGNTRNTTFTAEEEQLSNNMVTYWTNLAKTGNPEGASLPEWPLYNQDTGSYLPFNLGGMTTGTGLRARECLFWNSYVPQVISQLDDHCASDSSDKK